MSTWLTARELSGLAGFEMSERATLDKLKRLQVPHRSRAGRGGGREFDCSALPPETRQALMIDKIANATPPALVESQASPELKAPPPVPLTAPLVPVQPPRRPPSQSDRTVADARMVLVHQMQDLAATVGITRASQMLALQLASGQASPELASAARTANQRARTAAVSERTLYRWAATHAKDGWWGLLPAASDTPVTEVDQDVAAVLGLYHSRDAQWRNLSRAAIAVTKQLGRDYDSWKTLYGRARRALPKVNKVDLIKARHSGAERAAKLPFKRRDTSVLKPLDVWLIDGHTFKAKVRHPDHGAPFAPEVTMVFDGATRMIAGWSVALSENVIAVGDALRHAVGNCGIPALIYSDNGAGETAKQMDCPVAGIIARLGAEHRTGIPGHPQGHGLIERSWQTHMINCARQFASYQGKDVDSRTLRNVSAELAKEQRAIKRAAETGGVIQLSNKAPSWQQFIDAIERTVVEYNAMHRHRSLPKHASGPHTGKHMTPAEAWDAMLDSELQHKLGPQELKMLFMPAMLRVARRGEVTFLNQVYFAHDLMAVDGEQVRVHYDIHDPAYVLVFTLEGEFVCEAKWNANRMDYFPKPVIDMAREKRVKGIVKRRQAQIDTALSELQGTLQPANRFALPVSDAPVVLMPRADAPAVSSLLQQAASAPAGTEQSEPGRPSFFDTQGDRYEWLMQHRDRWDADDAAWVGAYVHGEDYAELAGYFESRGLAWVQSEADFKSAR